MVSACNVSPSSLRLQQGTSWRGIGFAPLPSRHRQPACELREGSLALALRRMCCTRRSILPNRTSLSRMPRSRSSAHSLPTTSTIGLPQQSHDQACMPFECRPFTMLTGPMLPDKVNMKPLTNRASSSGVQGWHGAHHRSGCIWSLQPFVSASGSGARRSSDSSRPSRRSSSFSRSRSRIWLIFLHPWQQARATSRHFSTILNIREHMTTQSDVRRLECMECKPMLLPMLCLQKNFSAEQCRIGNCYKAGRVRAWRWRPAAVARG